MPKYTFWVRDETGDASVAAEVSVYEGKIAWTGPQKKELHQFLAVSLLQGERFDVDDPEAYKRLPRLLTGSRLWVTEESQSAKEVLRVLAKERERLASA